MRRTFLNSLGLLLEDEWGLANISTFPSIFLDNQINLRKREEVIYAARISSVFPIVESVVSLMRLATRVRTCLGVLSSTTLDSMAGVMRFYFTYPF